MLVWYPPLLVSKPLKKCKEKRTPLTTDRFNVIFWLKSCKIKVTGGRQKTKRMLTRRRACMVFQLSFFVVMYP